MRLLFVADGRSPIALNWISYFVEQGHEVHLASTYPCVSDLQLASLNVVPVAFSGARSRGKAAGDSGKIKGRLWGGSTVRLRTVIRQWLGPLTLPRAAQRLRKIITTLKPDLVHAMRIPYEGMLSALADPVMPFIISVWGNDFTLHAPTTPLMTHYTYLALDRGDALHTDCHRDGRLAHAWGFSMDKLVLVLPGAGGVQTDLFYPPTNQGDREVKLEEERKRKGNTGDQPKVGLTVINPRGIRAYVRNDTFFHAIPLVLGRQPRARFLCPTMAGEPQAQHWLDELGIKNSVKLLPRQTRPQMAALFRQSRVAVSPSTHDGTPNTLLEAMACGCIPVAGDIESLREWIAPGLNGLLVDPNDPRALAQAILTALEQTDLYWRSLTHNTRLIAERAAYQRVMKQAEEFYKNLVT